MLRKSCIIQLVVTLFLALLTINWLNYWIIYRRIWQCQWPTVDSELHANGDRPLNVMFVTDVHIKSDTIGNFTENLMREWQMYWTFKLAKERFRPHAIIILGDLFDEGMRYTEEEYEQVFRKFENIFTFEINPKDQDKFYGSETKPVYITIHGNHDIGFHYEMTPYLKKRFERTFNLEDVQQFTINDIRFVSVNSMTMHGDNCGMCSRAVQQLQEVADQLCPEDDVNRECLDYNQPILLTHYPLYRESEEHCGNDWDTRAERMFYHKFVDTEDCMSLNATQLLLDSIRPRLAFTGHTHVSCVTKHLGGTEDWTIASFNYRYLTTPTILLAKFTKSDHAITKCILTHESVFFFYDAIIVLIFFVLWTKRIPQLIMRRVIQHCYQMKEHIQKYACLQNKCPNYTKMNGTRSRRPS